MTLCAEIHTYVSAKCVSACAEEWTLFTIAFVDYSMVYAAQLLHTYLSCGACCTLQKLQIHARQTTWLQLPLLLHADMRPLNSINTDAGGHQGDLLARPTSRGTSAHCQVQVVTKEQAGLTGTRITSQGRSTISGSW